MSKKDGEENLSNTLKLEETELIDRKRMRLEASARKRWGLADKRSDREVLEDLGVGLLDPDEMEPFETGPGCSLIKSSPKRKRNIENVNPNVNSSAPVSPRTKLSPKCTRSPCPKTRGSPRSAEKPAPASKHQHLGPVDLETTITWRPESMDEETPLPLLPINAEYLKAARAERSPFSSSVKSCDWPTSGGSSCSRNEDSDRRLQSSCSVNLAHTPDINHRGDDDVIVRRRRDHLRDGPDAFEALSDEVMLSIFMWLPKRTLVQCMLVSHRWHRVASDESFWQRLELGNRVLAREALGRILARKPIVIRLAGAEIGDWVNPRCEATRIQYLDLSASVVEIDTLNALLSRCPSLKKLSLESVSVDETTCKHIGRCNRMETLNLAMARGITASGLISILQGCNGLQALNISWCKLCDASLKAIGNLMPHRLQRLNIAGSRLCSDDTVSKLVERCPRLLELDLSDCTRLNAPTITAVARLPRLEHLGVSRCYLLPPSCLAQVSNMPSLQYLEVWGMLQDSALLALKTALPVIQINQFVQSAIARPTVGPRRTSIWGLRTRD